MSQIETIMLIILGFAVALLLILLLGKMVWGQAVGVGKRRSHREGPVTIAALQADKDKLRAEAAMLSRKLELRLDDLKTRLAEQTAEIARNRNRVDRLVGEINERDETIKKRDEELESIKAQMVPLEEELVLRTQNAQQLKEQMREQDDHINYKATLIDGLQEQLKNALISSDIVGQADQSATERLQVRISDLTNLSKQIEDQRVQLTEQHSELSTLTGVVTKEKPAKKKKKSNRDSYVEKLDAGSNALEKQFLDAEREAAELQTELAKLDDDWNDKLKQLEDVKSKTAGNGKSKTEKISKKTNGSNQQKTENESDQEDDDIEDNRSNVVSLAKRIRSLQNDIKSKDN